MYKEVNRSLIKWPVAASATMLAISWFPMDPAWDKLEPSGVSSVSPSIDLAVVPDLSGTVDASPTVVISSGDESDPLNIDQAGGAKSEPQASELPERVASVRNATAGQNDLVDDNTPTEPFASKGIIKAPVRIIDQELAGLGLGNGSEDSAGHAVGLRQEASGKEISPSQADGFVTLEQCERFGWGSASWITGAWTADFWQPDSDLVSVAAEKAKFDIPESSRELGRGDIIQPDLQEVPSRPSWADASEAVRSRLRIARDHCNDWIIVMARHSDKLKDFAAEHKLAHTLRTASGGSSQASGANSAVVPVGGVIPAEDEIAIPQVEQSVSRDVSSVRVAKKEPGAVWPEAIQLVAQL